jgi:hypothetical protein
MSAIRFTPLRAGQEWRWACKTCRACSVYNIALRVTTRDWLYILVIGVFLGMLLSSLGYVLLEKPWVDGALFGVILGFSVTLFSLVFISYMNKNVLPRLKEIHWLPLSVIFSFLSGFLGTLVGTLVGTLWRDCRVWNSLARLRRESSRFLSP